MIITYFRKILINFAKRLPFIFVFLFLIGQIEIVHSLLFNRCEATVNEEFVLYTPISNFIGNVIYIDWIDLILLYILCIALELCWRTFMCVYLIALNLCVRTLVERFYIEYDILIGIMIFLALCAIFCIWNGIELYITKKTN